MASERIDELYKVLLDRAAIIQKKEMEHARL